MANKQKRNLSLSGHALILGCGFLLQTTIAVAFGSDNFVLENPSLSGGGTSADESATTYTDQYFNGESSSDNYGVQAGKAYFKVPEPPQDLAVSTKTTTSIVWRFTDTAADEDGFRLLDASGQLKKQVASPNLSSMLETDLSPNTLYQRRIVSYNVFGESIAIDSGSASATTYAARPGAPEVTADYTNKDNLRHVVGIVIAGNPSGTQYTVKVGELYLQADGTVGATPLWSTATTLTHTALVKDTTHVYKVKARNAEKVETSFSDPTTTTVTIGGTGGATQEVQEEEKKDEPNNINIEKIVPDVVEESIDVITETVRDTLGKTAERIADLPVVRKVVDVADRVTSRVLDTKIAKQVIKVRDNYNRIVVQNPTIKKVQEAVVTPANTGLVALGALGALGAPATLSSGFSLLRFLFQIFTEPIYFLTRRRASWGVVYNALTKQSIDLAAVRIFEATRNKLVETRITDGRGRFQFYTNEGDYYIQVQKNGYCFPSTRIAGKSVDGIYDNLYFSGTLHVSKSEAQYEPVRVNIPLDPVHVAEEDSKKLDASMLRQYVWSRVQHVIAISGVATAIVNIAFLPGARNTLLLLMHIILLFIFYRLGKARRVRPWGIVYDAASGRSLPLSIVRLRLHDAQDIIDTRISDLRGRFGFLVNPDSYSLSVTKEGYVYPSQNTKPKKLMNYTGGELSVDETGIINLNIPLDEREDKPTEPDAQDREYTSYLGSTDRESEPSTNDEHGVDRKNESALSRTADRTADKQPRPYSSSLFKNDDVEEET